MRDTGVTQELFSKIFQRGGIGSQLCLSILKTGEVRKTRGGMNEEKKRRE